LKNSENSLFIFGNGNSSFEIFCNEYIPILDKAIKDNYNFILCDFRGIDVLCMEYLKNKTNKVTIYHIGIKPRYLPDLYKTKVSSWKLNSNHLDDYSRDMLAINDCSHYFGIDYNSNTDRQSGTLKNLINLKNKNKILMKLSLE
jgi:hypothetical protein